MRLLALFSFLFSQFTFAQSAEQPMLLMAKCRSQQTGILFASFGFQTQSGGQVQHFATGLTYNPTGEALAMNYDFIFPEQGTLKPREVLVRKGFMAIEFLAEGAIHRLTLLQLQNNLHGYQGNWSVTSEQGENLGQFPVECTVPQPVWVN